MRKSLIIIPIILFFVFNIYAQPKEADHNIFINGTIINTKSDHVKIGNYTTAIDESGNFEIRFGIKEADFFIFEHNEKIPLFLTPGDHLHLTLDAEDFINSLHFSGRGADVNNFIKNMELLDRANDFYVRLFFKDIFSSNENEYVAKLNAITDFFRKPLEKFLNSHRDIDEKFAKYSQASLLYSWAEARLIYPKLHLQFSRKRIKTSEDYDNYLSQLAFNDSSLIPVEEYMSFLNTYIALKADEEIEKNIQLRNMINHKTNARYIIAMRTFTDQTLKNHFLYSILKHHIENYGIKEIDDLLKSFKENCTDQKFLSEIDELYENEVAPVTGRSIKIYKTINDITLDAHIYSPPDLKLGDKRAAIIFFHGGGWNEGKPQWHWGVCPYFAAKGLVTISIEYRLTDTHNVTPLEAMADAKSAIRWVRQNAEELGIDPNRIVASGNSAGGHLAAVTAILKGFDEPDENMNINSTPNALILFSSVVNVNVDSWFKGLLKEKVNPEACSPVHHVRSGLPPTIIFHSVKDKTVPFWTVKDFAEKMKKAGNCCELHSYNAGGHFFMKNDKIHEEVMAIIENFFASLGYLNAK
jgi:acetyl esterase/lipase